MAIYRILELIPGDSLDVIRDIPLNTDFLYPLEFGWLTIKTDASLPDSAALVQKEITTTYSGVQGEIVNNADGSATIAFYLQPLETETLSNYSVYVYDIVVQNTAGNVITVEFGQVHTLKQVTHLG